MTKTTIKDLSWDEVQEKVRKYAGSHGFDVSQESHLTLADAITCSLRLYREDGLLDVASFYPFFRGDGTFKHVNVEYERNCGVEEFLQSLGVNL